jgi:divalent metal cation (Fe/Co/Zn/Cd) transporter
VPTDIDIIKCHEKIDALEKALLEELKMNVVVHMDPIETNDDNINKIKKQVEAVINKIDTSFTIHDFRLVNGEKQINLIFDVVVPSDLKLSESDLKETIRNACKTIDQRFETVITVDKNFL